MIGADALIAQTPHLPSPPQTLIKLLGMLDADTADARAVGEAVECDIGLSVRTLQLANSPFYGLSRRVTSIHEAVTILGLNTVRRLVLAVGSAGLMSLPTALSSVLPALLSHSARCASLARVLAAPAELSENEAFTAGMLHDVGKIVIAHAFPDIDVVARRAVIVKGDVDAERALCGYDHCQLGHALLNHWRLPSMLVDVARMHHASPTEMSRPVALVALADGLAQCAPEALAAWDAAAPVWAGLVDRALAGAPAPSPAQLQAAVAEAAAFTHVLGAGQ